MCMGHTHMCVEAEEVVRRLDRLSCGFADEVDECPLEPGDRRVIVNDDPAHRADLVCLHRRPLNRFDHFEDFGEVVRPEHALERANLEVRPRAEHFDRSVELRQLLRVRPTKRVASAGILVEPDRVVPWESRNTPTMVGRYKMCRCLLFHPRCLSRRRGDIHRRQRCTTYTLRPLSTAAGHRRASRRSPGRPIVRREQLPGRSASTGSGSLPCSARRSPPPSRCAAMYPRLVEVRRVRAPPGARAAFGSG